MGLLVNLKLRRKLFVALAPLLFVVIIARVYASYESKQIDTWYSQIIGNEVKAVHNVDAARAIDMRYGLYLYNLVIETEPDRMEVINAELNNTYADYQGRIADASRLYPAYAKEIGSAAMRFEKAVLDSRPVRRAALANEKQKAADLMRLNVELTSAPVRRC